jgi:hypothetical protein
MRKGKKVSVVQRWRTDTSEEIPIEEEDGNMIGAINAVNTLGDAATSLQNFGAQFGTVLRPLTYINAHVGAPFVAGHTVGKVLGPEEMDLRAIAFRGGYSLVSYVGHLTVNGMTTGWSGLMRDGGFAVASGMAGLYKSMANAPGSRSKKLTIGLPATIGLLGAGIKYMQER